MKDPIFLDTSGWLAASNPKDTHYEQAAVAYDELATNGANFVTSNLVVAEMHALIVRERGAKAGCALLDAIYSDPLYGVIVVDRDLELRATDNWLRRYTETRFSLTDAVSFQIMREKRIQNAFAIDHHFEIAGFRLVAIESGKGGRTSKRR